MSLICIGDLVSGIHQMWDEATPPPYPHILRWLYLQVYLGILWSTPRIRYYLKDLPSEPLKN